jgi:hypothetical protein
MIEDTIAKIEAQLRDASSINPDKKAELLALLTSLKREVAGISKTHGDEARSIAGFTQVSTHEAIRGEKNPRLLRLSLDALATSVAGFEKSHPRLVEAVNSICTTLSNLGI